GWPVRPLTTLPTTRPAASWSGCSTAGAPAAESAPAGAGRARLMRAPNPSRAPESARVRRYLRCDTSMMVLLLVSAAWRAEVVPVGGSAATHSGCQESHGGLHERPFRDWVATKKAPLEREAWAGDPRLPPI